MQKVTIRKKIREMCADELVQHTQSLRDSGTLRTEDDFAQYQECNEQFYQLTGDLLPGIGN